MATEARTADTTTPSKSGTKNPRGSVGAGTRGGKTTSVCEAPVQGSEPITPRAFLELYHERALHQIDACRGLLSCAQFLAKGPEPGFTEKWVRVARDWIDSAAARHATKLNGIFDALHRLAREDDDERELLPIQDGIEAALRRAHASRGAIPEGTRHEAAYRLAIDVREQWRQLQHGPTDDAEQLQRAGRWFVRWMGGQGGPGRLDTLSDACKVEYEAALLDLGGSGPADRIDREAAVDRLDANDVALLEFLAERPRRRVLIQDIEPSEGPCDRKAVSKRLRKLSKMNPALVEMPRAGRPGVAILDAGLAAIRTP
ncbi:MAG: hypothetical protein ACIAS6_03970 [Phycisphaerales bacterium JB060]